MIGLLLYVQETIKWIILCLFNSYFKINYSQINIQVAQYYQVKVTKSQIQQQNQQLHDSLYSLSKITYLNIILHDNNKDPEVVQFMFQDQQARCQNIYLNIDCLTVPDLAVEGCLILLVCLPAIVFVIFRLKKMYIRKNFTSQQLLSLKFHQTLYWHMLVYLCTFCVSLAIAVSIYLLTVVWDYELEESPLINALTKVFWWTLYGYVTLLNLIFTVIAYNFIVVARYLRHKEVPRFSKHVFEFCWVAQVLTIISNAYMIFSYQTDQVPDKFKILQFINLSQTILCTLVLVGIFFIIYKKVRKATTITITIKNRETKTIVCLTVLHSFRVIVEVFNIAFSGVICSWRWKEEGEEENPLFSIYLGIAHVLLNVLPVLFILKSRSFKPPQEEFRSQSIESLITNSDAT